MSGIFANKRSHQIDIQVHTPKITTCFIVNELDFYFTHYDSHRAIGSDTVQYDEMHALMIEAVVLGAE